MDLRPALVTFNRTKLVLVGLLCGCVMSSYGQQPEGKPPGKIVLTESAGVVLSRLDKDELQILGLQLQLKSLQTMVSTLQNALAANQSALQSLQTQFIHHTHGVTIEYPGHDCYDVDNFNLTTGAGIHENVTLGYIVKCPNGQPGIPASSQVVKSSPPQ